MAQQSPWHQLSKPTDIGSIVHSELKADAQEWFLGPIQLPSALLFSGPPGTGKTSTARLLAEKMLGDNFDEHNYYETNASDDRGIDFVRGDLKTILKVKPIGTTRKVVLVDEADGLTPAAQDAARQMIEKYSHNALLIFTCNEINKIRPAIQSRCKIYEFKPLSPTEGAAQLWEFLSEWTNTPEEWTEHLPKLVELMGGDLRACINYLESIPNEAGSLGERLDILENSAIDDLAVLAFNNEWQNLRRNLHKGISQGATLRQIMNRLYNDLKARADVNDDSSMMNIYGAMVAYGDIMVHIYTWPGDDYSFCDYMVATMRKEMKE